ncbi:MAG: hypothetical protein ABSA13_12450 [Beijerinckiaceae bacterium]|jgi:hypothetical protein
MTTNPTTQPHWSVKSESAIALAQALKESRASFNCGLPDHLAGKDARDMTPAEYAEALRSIKRGNY